MRDQASTEHGRTSGGRSLRSRPEGDSPRLADPTGVACCTGRGRSKSQACDGEVVDRLDMCTTYARAAAPSHAEPIPAEIRIPTSSATLTCSSATSRMARAAGRRV